jgi:Tol biopolymer transport system component
MIERDRTDLRIIELLQDAAPARTPAYAEAISRRARETSQRPSWSFPGRWVPWSPTVPLVPASRLALALLTLLLLILLGVAAIVGSARRVPPPFGPAGNGVIVVDDGTGIKLVAQDGQRSTQLPSSHAGDSRPAVSPDGQRVAFLRETNGTRAIEVTDIDGRNLREVVHTDGAEGGPNLVPEPPAWSPNSRHIAVTVLVGPAGDEDSQIWIVDVDTGARSVVLPGGLVASETPVWSPDGERLAFLGSPRHEPVGFLYVVRADGTGLVQLSRRESSARAGYFGRYRWSPDGTQIATDYGGNATSARSVLLIDVGSQREQELESLGRDASHPSWSPDGRSLAYWRTVEPHVSSWQVVLLDLATRRETVLPHLNASAESIAWAPDGTAVTVTDCGPTTCRLLLLDVANPARAPTRLADIPAKSLDESIESAYWSWQRVAR